jgi:hypothetical protein
MTDIDDFETAVGVRRSGQALGGGGRIPSHGFKDGSKGFGDKDRVWDRGHTTTTLNLLRCVVITDIVAGQGRGHFASKDMAELWEQD